MARLLILGQSYSPVPVKYSIKAVVRYLISGNGVSLMLQNISKSKDKEDIGMETHFHSWASYQIRKIAGWVRAGNAGNDFPADFKGNSWLAIPACITARASRTCRDECRDH